MAEQLWKGRFSKAVDSRVNDFNSSIRFKASLLEGGVTEGDGRSLGEPPISKG